MIDAARLDAWSRGWRGPLLAALLALAAALPGALAMPPLDRDESRFAQATAQMLETRDLVDIRYQDAPREKKPVGIHWLQAASVALASSAEARAIWAYRIPSLLGAMLAAAACAWGAAAFFGPGRGLVAGAILGTCFILATEAGIAKTDAVLCGATTLALVPIHTRAEMINLNSCSSSKLITDPLPSTLTYVAGSGRSSVTGGALLTDQNDGVEQSGPFPPGSLPTRGSGHGMCLPARAPVRANGRIRYKDGRSDHGVNSTRFSQNADITAILRASA